MTQTKEPPGNPARFNVLAKAKLQAEITPSTVEADFPSLLANDMGGTGNSDFIEAHIFGPVNLYTIGRLVGPKPKSAHDRELVGSVSRKMAELGVSVEFV